MYRSIAPYSLMFSVLFGEKRTFEKGKIQHTRSVYLNNKNLLSRCGCYRFFATLLLSIAKIYNRKYRIIKLAITQTNLFLFCLLCEWVKNGARCGFIQENV